MFVVPRRTVRTSQPQSLPRINWSNPLVKGLVDVIDFSQGTPRSLLLRTPAIPFGSTPQRSVTSSGIATDSSSAFGGWYFLRGDNAYASAEQTHIAVAEYLSESGYYAGYFCSADYSGTNASLSLQGTSNGSDLTIYPAGATVSGAGTLIRGTGINVIGLSASSSSANFYKNGKLIWAGSSSPAVQSNSKLVLFGERTASSGYAVKGRQLLHLVFNRHLSPVQHVSIANNPWQVFEDEEDYLFIPTAVGGGPASITGTLTSTLDSINTNFVASIGHSGTSTTTLQDISATISGTVGHVGNLAITLDSVNATFSGSVSAAGSVSGTVAFKLADIVASASGAIGHSGTVSANLADVMVSMAGTVAGTPESITGTLAITLDGIGFTASGNSGTITLTADDIAAIKNAILSDPKTLTVPKFLALK